MYKWIWATLFTGVFTLATIGVTAGTDEALREFVRGKIRAYRTKKASQ